MQNLIKQQIQKTQTMLAAIAQDAALLQTVETIARQCINALRDGGKILFAGNGGSAADAQHLAAELVSRYRFDRPGLPGIALTTDTSALTAIGNDYGYEKVFSRQVEALGQPGDIFFGISTSGTSPNILRAFETARAKKLITVGFTRDVAPMFDERCDFVLNMPTKETAKAQEGHILFGHVICMLIENEIFADEFDAEKQTMKAVTA